MLAIILFLALTLGNAVLYEQALDRHAHTAYSVLRIGNKRFVHYDRDAAVWREIAAFAITAVLYGAAASLTVPRHRAH